MTQRKRTILATIMTLVMIIGCLVIPSSGNTAEAASKLKVTCSQKTIAVNCSTTIKTNVKATYASSNKKIATVNSKGVVKGKKVGKVKITITSKSNKKRQKTVTITVKNQLVITAPENSSANLYVGDTVKIKTNLSSKYTSSNTDVATVNSSGKVTAKSAGTTKITVTAKSNKKLKKTVTITVQAKQEPTTEQSTTQTTTDSTTESTVTPNPGPTTETPTVEQPSTEKTTTEQPSTTEEPTTEQPSTQEPTMVGIEATYRGDKVPNDLVLINESGMDLKAIYSDGTKKNISLNRDDVDNNFDFVQIKEETIDQNKYVTYLVKYKGFQTEMTVQVVDLEGDEVYPLYALVEYTGEPILEGTEPSTDDFSVQLGYSDGSIQDANLADFRVIKFDDLLEKEKVKKYEYSVEYDYFFTDSNGNELYVCVNQAFIIVPYE
jgi:hypothetical protein